MEGKRENQQGYISFSLHPAPISPPAKKFVRMSLSVKERVAITLWRLNTTIEYQSLGHLFGVGLSTVCVAVHEVCTTIIDVLRYLYIRIPTEEDALKVVDVFFTYMGIFHNALARSMDLIFLS